MWPKEGVVELEDGRKIRLLGMYRHDIYCDLMEGSPSRQLNFEAIQGLEYHGRKLLGGVVEDKATMILPTLIWKRIDQAWDAVEWYQFKGMPPPPTLETRRAYQEWMPGTGTIALFRSDAIKNDPEGGDLSHLLVMWFQREPVEMIEAMPLAALRKIPWDTLAASWSN